MPSLIFSSFFIFLIIFSGLAYGSVTILPITVIETSVAFLILLWFVDMAYKKSLLFIKTGLFIPIVLLLGVIIFQLVYLPESLIRLVSETTFNLYKNFMPENISGPSFFTLSIYPNVTITELFKILSFISIFFIIINKIETKKQLDCIINTIIFFGLAISLFGIIQKYSYSGRVYWFDLEGSAGTPFGPFVNRNNFAGYINMIIPLAIGYFLTDMPLSKRIIYGSSIGIMSLALFLSLSRAGMLVYLAILLFFLLLSRFKETLKGKTKIILLWLILILCLFIFFMDFRIIWQRLSTLFKKESFIILGHGYSWLDITRIWCEFPIFGTGLGTFGNISSMYKTTPSQSLFTYAHNDYLQLLSEVGFLGFIFVSIFFILYFRNVTRMWLKRHNSYVLCIVLGGLSSIFGMLVYSLLDFNLHIPANAILFFITMGLIYRLVFSRFNHVIPK